MMGSIDTSNNHEIPANLAEIQYVLHKNRWDGDKGVYSGSLPVGLPQTIDGPMAWGPEGLNKLRNQWTLELNDDDVKSIETAMHQFKESNEDLQNIDRTTFPLPPALAKKLDHVSEACYNGLGFCLVRGMGPSHRSELENAILFGGVSCYVGSERGFQDIEREHVLAHLFKKYAESPGQYVPPSYDTAPLSFHTDYGDIIALYYPSVTSAGGRTLLASQHSIYNRLAMSRPDLLKTLTADWLFESFYKPENPPERRPILHPHGQDSITMLYSRLPFSRFMGSRGPRADIPPLTPLQIESLDALQVLSAENAFPVPAESGDLLFFNNVGLFHGREQYKDTGTFDTAPKDMDRHVLRLWLRDPTRTTTLSAPALQEMWEGLYGPNTPTGRKEIWNTKAVAAFAMNAQNNG